MQRIKAKIDFDSSGCASHSPHNKTISVGTIIGRFLIKEIPAEQFKVGNVYTQNAGLFNTVEGEIADLVVKYKFLSIIDAPNEKENWPYYNDWVCACYGYLSPCYRISLNAEFVVLGGEPVAPPCNDKTNTIEVTPIRYPPYPGTIDLFDKTTQYAYADYPRVDKEMVKKGYFGQLRHVSDTHFAAATGIRNVYVESKTSVRKECPKTPPVAGPRDEVVDIITGM